VSINIKIWIFEFYIHIYWKHFSIFIKFNLRPYISYTYGFNIEYFGWGIYYGRKEYFKWFKKYAEEKRIRDEQLEREWKESEEYKKLFPNREGE
jgi:hypothetical protein